MSEDNDQSPSHLQLTEYYMNARKRGMREYSKNISAGLGGYLPFLEGIIKNAETFAEVDLGVVDIPLSKIKGTYSQSRSLMFAPDFMPLSTPDSEFAGKWMAVCRAHLGSGLRDPIKAYEYFNWFYVVEGNKRISVLNYFNAFSYNGNVTRIIPKYNKDDLRVRIYYEFMEFYKTTRINSVWFTREASFPRLLELMDDHLASHSSPETGYKSILGEFYIPFRQIYHSMGGGKLAITTGDAFLEYLKVFGFPAADPEAEIRKNMSVFYSELVQNAERNFPEIMIDSGEDSEAGILSTLSNMIKPRGKIKVAFAYASTPQSSSWTYSHEMGRQYVEKILGEFITTSYIDNIPEGQEAYESFRQLARQGNDVIFATSPAFINAALRAAMQFKKVRFLSCSETLAYKHVKTYFGRMYEPRFLAGMIAASVTKNNILGYIGTYPMPGVISGINSFTLGARMVNPRVIVKVAWANRWMTGEKSDESARLAIEEGADIITHHNALSFPEISKEFGVYRVDCDTENKICTPAEYIASPVWDWGIFYEKILKTMLGTFRGLNESLAYDSGSVNFWWGMDSGIVDLYYSKRLVPRETQKLVELMKRLISSYEFHPFTGPVYDNKGFLRIPADETADREQILKMDWFVEGIDSKLPKKVKNKGYELPTIDMLEVSSEEQ